MEFIVKLLIAIFHTNLPIYLLALIGAWALLWWSIDNFRSIVQILGSVLAPYFQPSENKTLVERFGKWAVVTGSTDGIGKQYARELASNGLNIVLISRTASKLQQVAKEIESSYPVKTKIIVADFGLGQPIYEDIKRELQLLDIGVLVNNVGKMYEYPDNLENVPEEVLWQIININIGAVTILSRAIIPQMKENRRGIIVNISSGSECQPIPLTAVYGASKIYVKNLTLALSKELAEHNVQVQLVTPLFVKTKMNDYSTTVMQKKSLLFPDVESYTKFAIFTMGKCSRTTGFWSHGLQYAVMKLVPEFIRTNFAMQMNTKFRQEYFEQQKKTTNL